MGVRWFDDWHAGDVIEHPIHRTVTETDNLLFSALTYNPQPLHIDAEAAKKSEFGRIVVNSTFTFSLLIGLTVSETTLGSLIANLGFDLIRTPKPVFIGDTVHTFSKVINTRSSRSRPNAGIIIFEHTMLNHQNENVCQCQRVVLLKKRLV